MESDYTFIVESQLSFCDLAGSDKVDSLKQK